MLLEAAAIALLLLTSAITSESRSLPVTLGARACHWPRSPYAESAWAADHVKASENFLTIVKMLLNYSYRLIEIAISPYHR